MCVLFLLLLASYSNKNNDIYSPRAQVMANGNIYRSVLIIIFIYLLPKLDFLPICFLFFYLISPLQPLTRLAYETKLGQKNKIMHIFFRKKA